VHTQAARHGQRLFCPKWLAGRVSGWVAVVGSSRTRTRVSRRFTCARRDPCHRGSSCSSGGVVQPSSTPPPAADVPDPPSSVRPGPHVIRTTPRALFVASDPPWLRHRWLAGWVRSFPEGATTHEPTPTPTNQTTGRQRQPRPQPRRRARPLARRQPGRQHKRREGGGGGGGQAWGTKPQTAGAGRPVPANPPCPGPPSSSSLQILEFRGGREGASESRRIRSLLRRRLPHHHHHPSGRWWIGG
jgi:hypothetical protein